MVIWQNDTNPQGIVIYRCHLSLEMKCLRLMYNVKFRWKSLKIVVLVTFSAQAKSIKNLKDLRLLLRFLWGWFSSLLRRFELLDALKGAGMK